MLNEKQLVHCKKYNIIETETKNELNINVIKNDVDIIIPWPKYLIYVHMNDDYGATPSYIEIPIRDKEKDTRILWILKGLVSLNSNIQESNINLMTNNIHWSSWLMMLIDPLRRRTTDYYKYKNYLDCSNTTKNYLQEKLMQYTGLKRSNKTNTMSEILVIEFFNYLSDGFFILTI